MTRHWLVYITGSQTVMLKTGGTLGHLFLRGGLAMRNMKKTCAAPFTPFPWDLGVVLGRRELSDFIIYTGLTLDLHSLGMAEMRIIFAKLIWR